MVELEMQFIEFQSSRSILKQKFIDFRVDLENIEKKRIREGSTRQNGRKRTFKDMECHSRTFLFSTKHCNRITPYFHLHMLVDLYSQL